MNLDDETLLSALLDDELDPVGRAAVASEVASSPSAAGVLADLGAARALVRGLDRPAIPVDLSAAILTAIPPRVRRRRSLAGAGRLAASVVGMASIAASLLFAVALLFHALHEVDQPRPAQLAQSAPHRTDPIPSNPPIPGEVDAVTDRSKSLAIEATPPPIARGNGDGEARLQKRARAAAPAVAVAAAPEVVGPESARPGQLDALLGHRRVVRAVIVAEGLDQASRRVRTLIEQDADREPEFGQVSLAQGMVVDPALPGAAEVFVVVLPESGRDGLVGRLRSEYGNIRVEDEAAPATVAQLTEAGHAGIFAGARPAPLGPAPGGIAALHAAKAAGQSEPIAAPAASGRPPGDPLAAARVVLDPPGDFAKPAAPAAAPARPGREPMTVLVWVTRGPRP